MHREHQLRSRATRTTLTAVAGALSYLTIGCTDSTGPEPATTSSADGAKTAASTIQCDPDNGGLTLASGFCALVVAKDVGRARHMAVRPNGDLYVAIDNGPGGAVGGILALRDTDGDGRPDIQQRFGDTGGNGIAWSNGHLYFAPNDRVIRYSFSGDELVPTDASRSLAWIRRPTAAGFILSGFGYLISCGSDRTQRLATAANATHLGLPAAHSRMYSSHQRGW